MLVQVTGVDVEVVPVPVVPVPVVPVPVVPVPVVPVPVVPVPVVPVPVGGGLGTTTVTPAEVAVLPAASVATAVSVYEPAAAEEVSQETVYGAAATGAPRFAPSSLNWTLVTPTLSVAVADTLTGPVTFAPAVGAVIETLGGAVSKSTTALTTLAPRE
ncbi:MAG: hypothetical protein DMD91_08905 [Candidatus Rokuibacteriota bacterium]|nr:MAG: hypothetical protein DMD91_08905 [Candidatus Rokubacteria bacterium]